MVLCHLLDHSQHREEGQDDDHGGQEGVIGNVGHVALQVSLLQPQLNLAREEIDFPTFFLFPVLSIFCLFGALNGNLNAVDLEKWCASPAVSHINVNLRSYLIYSLEILFELNADERVL